MIRICGIFDAMPLISLCLNPEYALGIYCDKTPNAYSGLKAKISNVNFNLLYDNFYKLHFLHIVGLGTHSMFYRKSDATMLRTKNGQYGL